MPRNADSWRQDKGRRKATTEFTWFHDSEKRAKIFLTAMERRAGFLRRQTGTAEERRERVLNKLAPKRRVLEWEESALKRNKDMAAEKQLEQRRVLRGRIQHMWITTNFPEILEAILAELTNDKTGPRTLRQIASGYYPKRRLSNAWDSLEVNPLLSKLRVGKNTIAQWLYRLEAIARELYAEESW
jgi:hypothetical protein